MSEPYNEKSSPNPSVHLSSDLLVDFALGRLDANAQRSAELHLSVCDTCQAELDRLSIGEDSLVAKLRNAQSEMHAESNTAAWDQSIQDSITEPSRSVEPQPYVDQPTLAPTANLATTPLRSLGRYRIEKLLGRGGFGEVYQAWDEQLRRAVAIKVTFQRLLSSSSQDEYLAEARTVAGLDHPHIVPVYDVGQADTGDYFVVSKLIDGGDLSGRMKDSALGRLQAIGIIASIADALGYAHTKGLVHRDVKPANILIDSRDQAYLTDFGIALREHEFGQGAKFTGTPSYMSPEQARGEGHRVDNRSDIYSLGVVLYELLVGRRPFRSDNPLDMLTLIASEEVRTPRLFDETIAVELERICMKALARRASDRYPVARDFAEELRWYLGSAAMPMPHVPKSEAAQNLTPIPSHLPPHTSRAQLPVDSDSGGIQIVPKGLRSFDASDSDFFLALLPGPFDREGLPEALRFWKTRIESRNEQAIRIGLIYGPSGCGKSSLMKAGLLPRLASNIVAAYIEATSDDTEERLMRSIRKCMPDAEGSSLRDLLSTIRRRKLVPTSGKLLIVIDQFEQWLHATDDYARAPLTEALRQCDGTQIQAIVMVRDDFWLSVSRFLKELETPILEGENSRLVDLFDLDHAAKVLELFGAAYNKLPASSKELTSEHHEFIRQSVSGLAQERKVISVRLSIFADMMKSRDWTTEALRAVGGIEGVGVTFLEETFAARHAPAQHRQHQEAIRGLLGALLPPTGTDIKGNMRTLGELQSAAGYNTRPVEFNEVVQILDRSLRLITPVENTESQTPAATTSPSESTETRAVPASQVSYQLTHDYLVPSLREWLTRKQRETRKGRAELKLAERSAAWNGKPENKQLPTLLEWLSIRSLTDRRLWTTSQQRMMGQASRFHLRRSLLQLTAMATVLLCVIGFIWQANRNRRAADAANAVAVLIRSDSSQLSNSIKTLSHYRDESRIDLQTVFDTAVDSSPEKLRAAIGLVVLELQTDSRPMDYLVEAMLRIPTSDFLSVTKAVQNQLKPNLHRFWEVLNSDSENADRRLRAAGILAVTIPDDERWKVDTMPHFLVRSVLNSNPLEFTVWRDALVPIANSLLPAVISVFDDSESSESHRSFATSLIASYGGGDTDILANAITKADPASLQKLIPLARRESESITPKLIAILNRKLTPDWQDKPLGTVQKDLPTEITKLFDEHHGVLSERFAYCASMPRDTFQRTIEELRVFGYRPIKVRPFLFKEEVHFAFVLHRDAVDWRIEFNVDSGQIQALADRAAAEFFEWQDLSGYQDPVSNQIRYTCVWERSSGSQEQSALIKKSFFIDAQGEDISKRLASLNPSELLSLQCVSGDRGVPLYFGLFQQKASFYWYWRRMSSSGFAEKQTIDRVLRDVCVYVDRSTQKSLQDELRAKTGREQDEDDEYFRWNRARLNFHLGNDSESIRDFEWIASLKSGGDPTTAYYLALLYARNGDTAKVKPLIENARLKVQDPMKRAYFETIIAAHLGRAKAAIKILESTILAIADNPAALYDAACTYAQLANLQSSKNQLNDPLLRERALELLQTSLEGGFVKASQVLFDPEWDSFQSARDFRNVLEPHLLSYAGVWLHNPLMESREIHGLHPREHFQQANQLLVDGFRPASIQMVLAADQEMVSSVWHRPVVQDADLEALGRVQSNVAIALIQLGRLDEVLPCLQRRPDSRLRSWIIHKLAPAGVEPNLLWSQLERETDAGIRQALILALGEYPIERFSVDECRLITEWLKRNYEIDQDGGVHSACEWALKQFRESEWLSTCSRSLASSSEKRVPLRISTAKQSTVQSGSAQESTKWYPTSEKHCMLVFSGPIEFAAGTDAADYPFVGDTLEQKRKRRIDRSFAISNTLVTYEQIVSFDANGRGPASESRLPDLPAVRCNWHEAARYCNWLSTVEGIEEEQHCYSVVGNSASIKKNYLDLEGYRLPTANELEYAIRGGTTTKRPYGSAEELFDEYGTSFSKASGRILPVASQKPNNLGLFDSLGTVFCWTQNTAINVGGQWQDYETPTNGNIRVLLGSTFNPEYPVLSSTRGIHDIMDRYPQFGFRVARTIKKPVEKSKSDLLDSPSQATAAAGMVWYGTIDLGIQLIRIVVEPIARDDSLDKYQLTSIDQENTTVKLNTFRVSGSELFFQGNDLAGITFRGRMSSDNKSCEGEFTVAGRPYELKLECAEQANFETPSEIWEATLEPSETIVQLRVYDKGKASERILLDDLTHKTGGFIVEKSIVDGNLILRVPAVAGEWKGNVNEAGTRMRGLWIQNGQDQAVFRRK